MRIETGNDGSWAYHLPEHACRLTVAKHRVCRESCPDATHWARREWDRGCGTPRQPGSANAGAPPATLAGVLPRRPTRRSGAIASTLAPSKHSRPANQPGHVECITLIAGAV